MYVLYLYSIKLSYYFLIQKASLPPVILPILSFPNKSIRFKSQLRHLNSLSVLLISFFFFFFFLHLFCIFPSTRCINIHTLSEKKCKHFTFGGTTACHWGSTVKGLNSLWVEKVQMCHLEGTAPVTSCCTPKGTIFAPFFLRV